jgi:signal peptidase I
MVLASAFALMLAFRALVFSVHSVNGSGLAPTYKEGDRILVNRCSYGLRIKGHGLLPYCRLLRSQVKRGDVVAFTVPNDSIAGVYIARCKAVPGDTINTHKGLMIVPGLKTCAKSDYYWMEALNQQNPVDSRHLGFIPERSIIGRVCTVLYNRHQLRLP